MRSNQLILSALAVLSTAAFSFAAQAQSWDKKAYDATYEMQSPAGTMIQRRISDGKGRTRTEMTMPQGKKMTMIRDVPDKVSYMIIEESRMVMKNSINSNSPFADKGPKITSAEKAKEMGALPIGVKVIDGHPCHGFRHTSEAGTTEAWIGDDIGTLVFLDADAPGSGKMTMKLKSYNGASPSAALFQPPPGYKVMTMPGAMGGMPFGGGMPQGMPGRMKGRSPFGGSGMPSGFPGAQPDGIGQ